MVAKVGRPLAFSVSKVQITSSTVIGVPSCHLACGRSVKATEVRSSGHSIVSAIRPYIEKASSGECQHSVSHSAPMPVAGTPLMMKGCSELNVPWAPNLTVPPLGASGLTYSGGAASAGYLGSPCIAMAWLTCIFGCARRIVGAAHRAAPPANTVRRLIAMRALPSLSFGLYNAGKLGRTMAAASHVPRRCQAAQSALKPEARITGPHLS